MKTLRIAGIAAAVLLTTAASAQAVTYTFPVLRPTQAVVTGWTAFPGTDALTAILNNGHLESGEPLEYEGIVGGLNEGFTLSHYTLPLGDTVRTATVHAFGQAGCEQPMCSTPETGRWETWIAGEPEGQTHAHVGLEGPGSGWINATWTFNPEETGAKRVCTPTCTWVKRTQQEQVDEMVLGIKMTEYTRHNVVQTAYVQLRVESPS